jgi:hypothetical protein
MILLLKRAGMKLTVQLTCQKERTTDIPESQSIAHSTFVQHPDLFLNPNQSKEKLYGNVTAIKMLLLIFK